MNKTKVLFVIESLAAAGAEKSLISLLNELDYDKVEVDLQLFKCNGHFQKYLPVEVNLLPELTYFEDAKKNLVQVIQSKSVNTFKNFYRRLLFSLKIRLIKSKHPAQAKYFWQLSGKSFINKQEKEYDVAIAYAQSVPTFYVADSVRAKKKIAWVNVCLELKPSHKPFQYEFYKKFDSIVCVSEAGKKAFTETFPDLANRVNIIRDINSEKLLNKLLAEPSAFDFDPTKVNILTIGRLAYGKGYDLAISAAKQLKNSGIDFKWYFMGQGSLKKELEAMVVDENVTDNIEFLGVYSNPYSVIKNIDIYVQPSRFEGFGLALLEARSMLKPCVVTNFDAAKVQIQSEQNGLIVDLDPLALANGIKRIITDVGLKETIAQNQKNEVFFNTEEIKKVNALIGVDC